MWKYRVPATGYTAEVTDEQYQVMKNDIAFAGVIWTKLSEPTPRAKAPEAAAPTVNKPDTQAK